MCTLVIQVNFILKKILPFVIFFSGINELLNSRHSFRVFRIFDLTIMHPGAHHFVTLVKLNPQTEFPHPSPSALIVSYHTLNLAVSVLCSSI